MSHSISWSNGWLLIYEQTKQSVYVEKGTEMENAV